ncbi:MAG TPA: universal stress protein [Candidatus Nitrosocosmicus sp.]|nr:universal stress protein [Candidatus Nitrosocosmicus sp.]
MATENEKTNTKTDITNPPNLNDDFKNNVQPNSNSGFEFDSNNLSFKKILVTYDGSGKSNKAINYSIYLSKISEAEITILQVIGNIDKLENSSIDVSSDNKIPLRKTNSDELSKEAELIH